MLSRNIFFFFFYTVDHVHLTCSEHMRSLACERVFLKHGVGQNIATYAPPAFRNFFLVLISTFPGLPIFHTLVGILRAIWKGFFTIFKKFWICFVCVYLYFYFGKLCVMASHFYVTPTWLRASNLEPEKSGLNKHSEGYCYGSLSTWAHYCLARTAFWWWPWWCFFCLVSAECWKFTEPSNCRSMTGLFLCKHYLLYCIFSSTMFCTMWSSLDCLSLWKIGDCQCHHLLE